MNQVIGWILIIYGVTCMFFSGRNIFYKLQYKYYDKKRGGK